MEDIKTARYSIIQDAGKNHAVVRVGSMKESVKCEQGFAVVFTGNNMECYDYMAKHRYQFPFDKLNAR